MCRERRARKRRAAFDRCDVGAARPQQVSGRTAGWIDTLANERNEALARFCSAGEQHQQTSIRLFLHTGATPLCDALELVAGINCDKRRACCRLIAERA